MTSKNNLFSEGERRGIYKAIYERRDIRSYLPNPVDENLLLSLLAAAHQAPSVGFMQPWNFIIIKDMERRKRVYENFREVNDKAALNYAGDKNATYRALKLQGILDSPLNLLITCDTKRGGTHVLGRATIPETDVYSTCLAIENFWLAARAEGVGVGWMSLHDPAAINEIFQLPEGVIAVAYLTVGYPIDFPDEPLLQSVGWAKRIDLDEVIFYDTWGATRKTNKISKEFFIEKRLIETSFEKNFIPHPDAKQRLENLTKPQNSLGSLEDIILKLSAIQEKAYPEIEKKSLILMAGDHGIADESVSAYNSDLTARMVYQFVAGAGAVNAIARQNEIDLKIIDMGVNHDFGNATGIIHSKVRRGTRNFSTDCAMSLEEVNDAVQAGRNIVLNLPRPDILALGEMGIGNSASASAITAAILGLSAAETVGFGTGIGPQTLQKKIDLIDAGLSLHKEHLRESEQNPLEILRCFGGYEIAGLVGAILQSYDDKIPVLLDGFITGAAALICQKIEPQINQILFAGHRSKEPAHALILNELKLKPILQLDMGLGEGSGAALAMNLIETSVRILREMRTFEEAGIQNPLNEKARK